MHQQNQVKLHIVLDDWTSSQSMITLGSLVKDD